MKLLYLFFISIILFSCKPKDKKEVQKIIPLVKAVSYAENLKSLFVTFKVDSYTPKTIYLIAEPTKFVNIGNFLADSCNLTSVEIKFVEDQSNQLSKRNFDKNIGSNIQILPQDSIDKVFSSTTDAWSGFRKRYGNSFIKLSPPIFLRENTLCIVYLNKFCGGNCGNEEIRLYKNVNGNWKLIKTSYGWIS